MKYLKFASIAILFAFLFQACEPTTTDGGTTPPPTIPTNNGQVTDTGEKPTPTVPQPVEKTQSVEALESLAQAMSTTSFNNELGDAREKGEAWTASPITVALRFAGEGFDCRKKTIDVESLSGGESFDKVLVSITQDGFLDDSVRGDMVILRMEQTNGFWKITSAKKVWKCWENRGHTEFSSEPCH